jgi:hypothetical protein
MLDRRSSAGPLACTTVREVFDGSGGVEEGVEVELAGGRRIIKDRGLAIAHRDVQG